MIVGSIRLRCKFTANGVSLYLTPELHDRERLCQVDADRFGDLLGAGAPAEGELAGVRGLAAVGEAGADLALERGADVDVGVGRLAGEEPELVDLVGGEAGAQVLGVA